MAASPRLSTVGVPQVPAVVLADLHALLLTELHAKAAERAEHEVRAASLTGHTDPDSLLERELAELGATRAGEAIVEIEQALARIEQGTYGRCEACRAAVAPERLEAIPHVRYCVACSVTPRALSS